MKNLEKLYSERRSLHIKDVVGSLKDRDPETEILFFGRTPQIGDKIRFVPAAWADEFGNARSMMGQVGEVTGTVIQVNEEKGWYRVQYELPGCTGFETFKI